MAAPSAAALSPSAIHAGNTAGWLILCLGAVLLMPALVLLVGPLLFGVPHLLSELRVFARRLQPSRNALLVVVAPLALLILLRVAEQFGLARPQGSDVMLGCAALLAAAAIRPGTVTDRIGRSMIALGISAFALYDTWLTTIVLAHLHNLIAVVFLISWVGSPKRSRDMRVLCIGLVAGIAMLYVAAPPASDAMLDAALPGSANFLSGIRLALAPGLSGEVGHRLVLVYGFAQLMHYVVWLVWMPTLIDDNAARTARRPTQSVPFVPILIALMLALPLLSMMKDPIVIRDQYLALSSFHGWLELSVLAWCGLRIHAH
jgi:hypothetical protein